MRKRFLSLLVLGLAGGTTLSLLRGQDRPAAPAPAPPPPAPRVADAPGAPAGPASRAGQEGAARLAAPAPVARTARPAARDFSNLGPLQQQMLNSAQRGADWLFRMNGVKGRFLYGYLPALKVEMEGDNYLRQIGAAATLARAARFTGEERYAVRATQAILALLDETIADPNEPRVRHIALPSLVVNRLGAAGLLVLAINELPAPQADLLERSEELCQYIRRQARPDGSLRCDDAAEHAGAADSSESIAAYPGLALYGLVRSQQHRPAAWKLDLLRKAASFYRPWWQAHKSLAFIPPQSAACAEAYLLTHEPVFAQFVVEMNDWLCGFQYDQIDPRRILWYGGFLSCVEGRKVESPPDVGSAASAESLAGACRVACAAGDAERHQRYTEALERSLQFLVTLQYTDANTQHFADWYRPRIAGAFHASHQDGNVRLDYTQRAVSALVQYLEQAIH
jgi:uncharacterized protein (UPF0147 family)